MNNNQVMKGILLGALLAMSTLVSTAHSETTGTDIALYDKDTVALYLKGRLSSDESTEFMLDTGSGYVTINHQTLRALESERKARYSRDITALMADGRRKRVPIYQITELELGEGCMIRDIEAAVMPGATRNILGLSALKKAAPFTVSLKPPKLTLQNCEA